VHFLHEVLGWNALWAGYMRLSIIPRFNLRTTGWVTMNFGMGVVPRGHVKWVPSPRHGVSSDCGWRHPPDMEGRCECIE
jgi:hypothetical protein